jgi:hypothetical protein
MLAKQNSCFAKVRVLFGKNSYQNVCDTIIVRFQSRLATECSRNRIRVLQKLGFYLAQIRIKMFVTQLLFASREISNKSKDS